MHAHAPPRNVSQAAPRPEYVIDELMGLYVEWRETCADVGAAYRRWTIAESTQRARFYDAYSAALDREHEAAVRYEARAERALASWRS